MAKIDLVPYWLEEKDWLCVVEFLPHFDDEAREIGVEAIGHYFGYAQMTDTRMLALLGDPKMPAYELLFSFSSDENKRRFLELVQSNELTETEPEMIMVPCTDEIRDARPLAMVLDEDIVGHVTAIAASLTMETCSSTHHAAVEKIVRPYNAREKAESIAAPGPKLVPRKVQ